MAAEISWRAATTGSTVYATIRSAVRTMWNGAVLEALTVANWGDYDIALTETPASSYFYVGDWPATLTTVGFYWVDVYLQAGASPAIGDTMIGGIIGYWNGTTLDPWDCDTVQVGGTAQTAGDLAALIGAISVGAGGLSVNASSVTVTTGTETNAYTDTFSAGTIHIVSAAGGVTLFDYNFELAAYTGTATAFLWSGYVQTNGDTVSIQYYDWVGGTYKTLRTVAGAPGTTLQDLTLDVPVQATGTGANFGLVKMRFTSSTTTNIGTDRVRCEFSTASGGITNGSTITLAATQANKNFSGYNWVLALGGQDISGSFFSGATTVTGIASGSTDVTFRYCNFGAATIPPGNYDQCGFGLAGGTLTAASAGTYNIDFPKSRVAGGGTPVYDWATATGTLSVNFRGNLGGGYHYIDSDVTISVETLAGGTHTFDGGGTFRFRGTADTVTVLNHAAGKTSKILGLVGDVNINGTGGTVIVKGCTGTITDNSGGAVTITSTEAVNLSNMTTTQMAESYAADGTAPTLAQALFLIQQSLHEFAISGTTRTVKKLDGSTTAATFTLDSATAPTSTTRAT